MRIGLVDLGTNSIRCDIYDIGSKITHLHRSKDMIRLGQGVFRTGKLDEGAIDRLMRTLAGYRQLGEEMGVHQFQAFATSALREAADADRVRERVANKTGIEIEVISGAEEAKLIALGILANEKRCTGEFAIVDIGGGSTEICLCKDQNLVKAKSLELGVQRLQQVYLKSVPPRPTDVESLRTYVSLICHEAMGPVRTGDRGLGSSGTIKALARILKKTKDENSIRLESLQDLITEMRTLSPKQLLEIPGMSERRVDVILAGSLILEGVMECLNFKKVNFTPYAMRDGLLLRLTGRPQ